MLQLPYVSHVYAQHFFFLYYFSLVQYTQKSNGKFNWRSAEAERKKITFLDYEMKYFFGICTLMTWIVQSTSVLKLFKCTKHSTMIVFFTWFLDHKSEFIVRFFRFFFFQIIPAHKWHRSFMHQEWLLSFAFFLTFARVRFVVVSTSLVSVCRCDKFISRSHSRTENVDYRQTNTSKCGRE